ncbi:MAG: 3-keto-5-aminohexanoate cleavage protein [Planctomycetaceae bacterium]|nr:MAG: 3-keto-5-aminohexanoate cleavage protein [Planctomycetaceae bacterium]
MVQEKLADLINLVDEVPPPEWQPLHIKVAPTGLAVSRQQSPYLPITPDEIAQATIESYQAGASAVHLHMRDDNGIPTNDLNIFRRVIDKIKASCPDIIIDIPSILGNTDEEKLRPLTLPEVETTALQPGPMIVGSVTIIRTPDSICRDLDFMLARNIHPEIATHDLSHLANAERLIIPRIQKPYYFNIVLGLEGSTYATPENLLHIVHRLPAGSQWMVSIGGRPTLDMLTFAILLGGHIRVGLEDMIYLYPRKNELATSNAQLVEKMVRIATELGRPIATPAQARQMLGFNKGPKA